MSGIKVFYKTNKQWIPTSEGHENLLEALLAKKIPIDHSCEGMASCGTCRIIVTSNIEDLPPRNTLEQDMATDRQFEAHERLACQLCPKKDLSFQLPKDLTTEP